ncbi:ABERRANT POLLEN DEVELOPMENT 3 [Hibiscus trionum]|uniref:ABERRANT POLLEN DEVELOPMENT 3 n=1 Tax=Hibiscus trionum TaxID=183268 RepID=A0A9W7I5G8_HIBTR|nr:ABERRANT POLLEN DEVELOPMENT 3 [Hibiscus trionum]
MLNRLDSSIPFTHPAQIPRFQGNWTRFIPPMALWICVSTLLRFGTYGDRPIVLGPNTSRLMKATSVFAQQVEVRDGSGKEALVYEFSDKPELSKEVNWSSSSYFIVGSYGQKGYSLWLNKGSKICVRWATQTSRLDKTEAIIIKGGREEMVPGLPFPFNALFLNEPLTGKEAEFTIDEDNKYYVGVINSNPRRTVMTFDLNVTSKVYDVSKARNVCSTLNGTCRFDLHFPNTKYVVVAAGDHADINGRYVVLSFAARVVSYIAILAFFITVFLLVLKFLGACNGEETAVGTMFGPETSWRSETDPILPAKPAQLTYGTTAEKDENDETGSSSGSSEDLYDLKLCVICYDDQRNCFFVPCGHCATCYECAQRIMEEDNKMCPICRRVISKLRRLFSP